MQSKSQLLEQAIHRSIPLTRTLEFHIQELSDDAIQVVAPLAPNINIHNAAFAGSIYSVAVLSAWGLVTHLVNEAQIKADVVIGKAEIRYRKPIVEPINCQCRVNSAAATEFISALRSKGRNKLELSIDIGNSSEASLNAIMFATCVE